MVRCSKCKRLKQTTDFYKDKRHSNGLNSQCKLCSNKGTQDHYKQNKLWFSAYAKDWRSKNRVRANELSRESFRRRSTKLWNKLFAIQKGKCPIYKRPLDITLNKRNRRRSHIDHNHSTGRIRGLLCMNCNFLLGAAREDAKVLENARQYLKKHA